MKKAIIVGASSGIGKELAKCLSKDGYVLGLAARRDDLLEELQKQLPTKSYVQHIDVTHFAQAQDQLQDLIVKMDGVDLIILSAGIGHINLKLEWEKEKDAIDVNVMGFTAMATVAMRYFYEKGRGHLVNISSIVALRGNDSAPAYSASKAYETNYLQAMRKKVFKTKTPIYVTDILPGFVDTEMAKQTHPFWMSSADVAAEQIYEAIRKKKKVAYITKKWRIIAWLLKYLPDSLYHRF